MVVEGVVESAVGVGIGIESGVMVSLSFCIFVLDSPMFSVSWCGGSIGVDNVDGVDGVEGVEGVEGRLSCRTTVARTPSSTSTNF